MPKKPNPKKAPARSSLYFVQPDGSRKKGADGRSKGFKSKTGKK